MAIIFGLAAAALAYLVLVQKAGATAYNASSGGFQVHRPPSSDLSAGNWLADTGGGSAGGTVGVGEGDGGAGGDAAAGAESGGIQAAQGFASALGPIGMVGGAIFGAVLGGVIRHHQEAVKKEAQTILQGVERYYDVIKTVVQQYNRRQLTRAQAIAGVMAAMQIYYQAVAPMMKPSTPPEHWGMLGQATSDPNGVPPFRKPLPPPKPLKSYKGQNGPFDVGYMWIEPFSGQLVRYFTYWAPANGFTYTNPAMPPSASKMFPGIGSFKVILNPGGLN